MPFTISYHKEAVKNDIPALPAAMKVRIKSAIETKLIMHPEQYALPLRRTLKGYWKLRVGDYRIIFEFDRSTDHSPWYRPPKGHLRSDEEPHRPLI